MPLLLIATPCLLLRNMKPADLADFLIYRSDPEVVRYQGFDVMNETGAAEFIEDMATKSFGEPGEWLQLSIQEKLSGRVVGDCAIHLPATELRMAEIGITLSPAYRSRGFAREAIQALLHFLFVEKHLHRVYAITDLENKPAIALLESVPFRREGTFIEHAWFKGRWASEVQFALLRREWMEKISLASAL